MPRYSPSRLIRESEAIAARMPLTQRLFLIIHAGVRRATFSDASQCVNRLHAECAARREVGGGADDTA